MRGEITRLAPHTYALADIAGRDEVRVQAALRYVGSDGALSHVTALAVWGLIDPPPDIVHVTVPSSASQRSTTCVIVHRPKGFSLGPPVTVVRRGFEVVRLERAVAESWPLLEGGPARRAVVIRAVGDRLTTPDRLIAQVLAMPILKDRAALLGLLDLLASGCRSEFEIYGYLHVFTHPDLPEPELQLPVQLGSRTIYLDVAYDEVLLNLELDGWEFHHDPEARDRDHLRDIELAKRDWQTIRYSPKQLRDPVAVRHDVNLIYSRRRRLFGLD